MKARSRVMFLSSLLVLVLPVASYLSVSAKSPPKTSVKEKMAKEVFKLSGTDKELKQIVDTLLAMQIKASPLPTLIKAKLGLKKSTASSDQITEEITRTLKEDMDIANQLETEFARAYAKEFSQEELRTMINFYKSPAGKKGIKIGEQFTREIQGLKKTILNPGLDKALQKALKQAPK